MRNSITNFGYQSRYWPEHLGQFNPIYGHEFDELEYNALHIFNKPLDNWNVSHAPSLDSLFYNTTSFIQSFDCWYMSAVTSMTFHRATSFNQIMSAWNVLAMSSMHSMFQDAISFNQNETQWSFNSILLPISQN